MRADRLPDLKLEHLVLEPRYVALMMMKRCPDMRFVFKSKQISHPRRKLRRTLGERSLRTGLFAEF